MITNRLRQAEQRRLALPGDAQLAKFIGACLCKPLRAGEKPRQPGNGCGNGFTKPVHQPLTQRARGGDGDLLPQYGAHGQRKTVQRPWQTQRFTQREISLQHAVDGVWVGVQVQPGPHQAQHLRQLHVQAVADGQVHAASGVVKTGLQPTGAGLCAMVQAQCGGQARLSRIGIDHFTSG